jgi:hypothetical protein
MRGYSDFVDRIFVHDDLLRKLVPTEPFDRELVRRVKAADDATVSGGRAITEPEHFKLVRGALLYVLDAIDEAHRIFQEAPGDLGSYWHGMMHRREGDFDNARYWFRRAGVLPVFAEIHRMASQHSSTMARQLNWDPYLFTGECEQARFGAEELTKELAAMQQEEFYALFDYCWRHSGLEKG